MHTHMKKETKILPAAHVNAMVNALRDAGLPVKSSETGYWVKLRGRDIFRAMVGGRGDYLVRHAADLFA